MRMSLKAVLDPSDTERPGRYSAFVELRVGGHALLRSTEESVVSQATAFEQALRRVLQFYDPEVIGLELSPFDVRLADLTEGERSGFRSRVVAHARVAHGEWTFERHVEHTDTETAICFLLFDAYDDHFTHRKCVGLRDQERRETLTQPL